TIYLGERGSSRRDPAGNRSKVVLLARVRPKIEQLLASVLPAHILRIVGAETHPLFREEQVLAEGAARRARRAVHDRPKAHTVEDGWRSDAEQIQDRRSDVDRPHDAGNMAAFRETLRPAQDQGDPQELVVEGVAVLDAAVLPELLAVVAETHDERVACQPSGVEGIQDHSDCGIDCADLVAVESTDHGFVLRAQTDLAAPQACRRWREGVNHGSGAARAWRQQAVTPEALVPRGAATAVGSVRVDVVHPEK